MALGPQGRPLVHARLPSEPTWYLNRFQSYCWELRERVFIQTFLPLGINVLFLTSKKPSASIRLESTRRPSRTPSSTVSTRILRLCRCQPLFVQELHVRPGPIWPWDRVRFCLPVEWVGRTRGWKAERAPLPEAAEVTTPGNKHLLQR